MRRMDDGTVSFDEDKPTNPIIIRWVLAAIMFSIYVAMSLSNAILQGIPRKIATMNMFGRPRFWIILILLIMFRLWSDHRWRKRLKIDE